MDIIQTIIQSGSVEMASLLVTGFALYIIYKIMSNHIKHSDENNVKNTKLLVDTISDNTRALNQLSLFVNEMRNLIQNKNKK